MGGTCAVREEPGKQKPRSCRAQELARSRARENAWQKKVGLLNAAKVECEDQKTEERFEFVATCAADPGALGNGRRERPSHRRFAR